MDFIKLTDNGLKIATRQEIYEQLCVFARAAYGSDISLDAGTPFEVFIGMLSDSLSNVNGATQSVSELFSTKELSGNFLDFVAGQRGVIRKIKRNQKVTVTVTIDPSANINRPFVASANTIYLQDNLGRTWLNTSQLLIQDKKFSPTLVQSQEPNYQGTCEFTLMPLDGYDSNLLKANNNSTNTPLTAVAPSDPMYFHENDFTFVNYEDALPAIAETESDPQLRARYDNAVYSSATSTIDALRSNLLEHANYVRIIQNLTDSGTVDANTNPYGIAAHSIWVIVDGGSTSANNPTVSTDANDITVAQAILRYKSLGCGVSLPTAGTGVPNGHITVDGVQLNTGNFLVEFPMDTMIAQIPFTRLIENAVKFEVELTTTSLDTSIRDSVKQKIVDALKQYINSLEPGDVITKVDTVNAIYSVLSQYPVGEFDFVSSTESYDIGSSIEIYQRAVVDDSFGVSDIVFSDEV